MYMNAEDMIIKSNKNAGLFYAYDENNEYVFANDAIPKASYTCPICGCPMHLTTRSGNKIFARNPHQHHTDSRCITIEKKGIERSFQSLSPQNFISQLCYSAPRKKIDSDRQVIEGRGGLIYSVQQRRDIEFGKLMPFTSLKQIAESGVSRLNAYDKQGEHEISDFIMTYKFARPFFEEANFQLGARIVYARFDWVHYESKSILFSMFGGSGFSVRFKLIFPSNANFRKYSQKFVAAQEDIRGKVVIKKIHVKQDVLLASDDWTKINKSQCSQYCVASGKCTTCVGMYQAFFTNAKQVYLIPN